MEENNKRIFKNTLYLYGRMLLMMCISFFTTRIVLEKLGVSDYGLYNVVGGFVSMFSVFNSILQTSTNRFLALSIGKGDQLVLKRTFSTAIAIHLIIVLIVFICLESFGIWFVNYKMNIDPSRLYAANWVFQLSVLSSLLAISQTPYSAAITSHEKFDIYAYLSIFDVVFKLVSLYLLVMVPADKLIVYASLMLISSVINRLLNHWYCVRHFSECKFSMKVDRNLFKQMFTFSGWTAVGHIAAVLNGNGVNILINMFFGTTVNAARGLAITVTFTIKQFVGGFIMAAQPQLIKYYANDEKKQFVNLIFNITRVTLFLLSVFFVPVLLEIDFVLKLWLTEVPQYTSTFIKITLLLCFVSYSNNMVDYGIGAIGRVKVQNIWSTSIYLSHLPLCYLVLKLGGSPVDMYWVSILPMLLATFMNMYILNKYYYFPIMKYSFMVVGKNLMLVVVAAIIPLLIQHHMDDGFLRFFVVCSSSVMCTIVVLWLFGLNKETKTMILSKVVGKYLKKFREK